MAKDDITRHTLSVLVEDIEGIISRVTGMFTRRGYNPVSYTHLTLPTSDLV